MSCLFWGLVACAQPSEHEELMQLSRTLGRTATTFDKFLTRAGSDDARSQNLIGHMLFFGEGVERDRELAYIWFEMAAENGDHLGARNLAFMKAMRAGGPIKSIVPHFSVELSNDMSAKNLQSGSSITPLTMMNTQAGGNQPEDQQLKRGAAIYARFCSGCHGLNGIAAYIGSPSFALAERLGKTDPELLDSIRGGMGVMPGWEDKLPDGDLVDVLAYVRTIPRQYEIGIAQSLRSVPQRFFMFGPMRTR